MAQLKERMERTLKATITVVPSEAGGGSNRAGRLQFSPLIHTSGRRIAHIFPWAKSPQAPELPLANVQAPRDEPPGPGPALGQPSKLYIMSCVQRNWNNEILLQDPIDDIATDREFFAFLKSQVRRRRHRAMLILSCRRIHEIHFVKVSPKWLKCCSQTIDQGPVRTPQRWPVGSPRSRSVL